MEKIRFLIDLKSYALILILTISFMYMKKNNVKNFGKKYAILFFALIFILLPPFEDFFLKFNTIEETFNFKHPNGTVIESYSYNEYATIFYIDEKAEKKISAVNIIKINNKWKNKFNEWDFNKKYKSAYNDECSIKQLKNDFDSNVFVYIICSDMKANFENKPANKYIVKKASGEELKRVDYEQDERYIYYAMFTDKDTYIYINDKKIMLD